MGGGGGFRGGGEVRAMLRGVKSYTLNHMYFEMRRSVKMN